MLGHGSMGRSHSHAYRTLEYMMSPPPLSPRLSVVAGRDEVSVSEMAARFGFERHVTDWRALIADSEIQLFDNVAPNHLHAEPTIAAAQAGKHVICEKPLGRSGSEAYAIWQSVALTGVVHMCGFNYRFIPAVQLARAMIEAGDLGSIRHFRGRYLQEWGTTTEAGAWRFSRDHAGAGALGDLGPHVIDLARYLVGEITSVAGSTATFRPGREVDDAFAAAIEFEGGAIGTIEASRFAPGRKNALSWEINGSRGSIAFELERTNELQVSDGGQGFRRMLVGEREGRSSRWLWPPGHMVGWEQAFVHELEHLLATIAGQTELAPIGATFEDGYRAAEVCDAILRSAATGSREPIRARDGEDARSSQQRL